MNVQHLIHSVVQQTTVLIAQLATSGGVRAPLAHIAGQVFTDLASELEAQGLSRKVTADMFGISLRSYQRRVARLKESSSVQGKTLWEALLEEVTEHGSRTREELLSHFRRDDEEVVRSLLHDLVESSLLKIDGSGPQARYLPVDEEEFRKARSRDDNEGLAEFVWALVFRHQGINQARLQELSQLPTNILNSTLKELLSSKRIQVSSLDGEPQFVSQQLFIERGSKVGWEASVYDHFQAMVSTIISRLNPDPDLEDHAERTGGSTYGFDISPDHPHREEVLSLLDEFREKSSQLRARVTAYNQENGTTGPRETVLVYAGQRVTRNELE